MHRDRVFVEYYMSMINGLVTRRERAAQARRLSTDNHLQVRLLTNVLAESPDELVAEARLDVPFGEGVGDPDGQRASLERKRHNAPEPDLQVGDVHLPFEVLHDSGHYLLRRWIRLERRGGGLPFGVS